MDPSVYKSKLKKRYKEMAMLLHLDKNKTAGAEGETVFAEESFE